MLQCMTLIIVLGSLVLFQLYSFIQLFFFLHSFCLPGTVLGTWDIQANEMDQDASPREAYVPLGMEETNNRQ